MYLQICSFTYSVFTNIILFAVPVEARAFLGAVAAFVVFLFVFFLYLNKKLCFYTSGGIPCCDDAADPKKFTKDSGKFASNQSFHKPIYSVFF